MIRPQHLALILTLTLAAVIVAGALLTIGGTQ